MPPDERGTPPSSCGTLVFVRNNEFLFSSGELDLRLKNRQHWAWVAIRNWNPDEFLATPAADIVAHLVAKHSLQCPVLLRDRAEQLPVTEELQQGEDAFGEIYDQRMTKIVIVVPFEGEALVFDLRASTSSALPPSAVVCGRTSCT